MPGFDGTGPRGMGPMTGGGRGFCTGYAQSMGYPRYPVYGGYPIAPGMMPNTMLPNPYLRRGLGLGPCGMGMAWGRGRGMGRGRW
ncbi:MAG: DUF5320 domain-containing protein [Armatimonadetes bacterium]|nr:DUF5320 domain-containing protein [Armatimonadota bacterium]